MQQQLFLIPCGAIAAWRFTGSKFAIPPHPERLVEVPDPPSTTDRYDDFDDRAVAYRSTVNPVFHEPYSQQPGRHGAAELIRGIRLRFSTQPDWMLTPGPSRRMHITQPPATKVTATFFKPNHTKRPMARDLKAVTKTIRKPRGVSVGDLVDFYVEVDAAANAEHGYRCWFQVARRVVFSDDDVRQLTKLENAAKRAAAPKRSVITPMAPARRSQRLAASHGS